MYVGKYVYMYVCMYMCVWVDPDFALLHKLHQTNKWRTNLSSMNFIFITRIMSDMLVNNTNAAQTSDTQPNSIFLIDTFP